MFLNDITILGSSQQFKRLEKTLKRDHGVDLSPYKDLSESELKQFIIELDNKKKSIVLESDFSDQFQDPEYVKASLISEACKMILREISPKRIKKNNKIKTTNETLDFKVDVATGAAVDHITGDYEEESEEERKERPDLYWRRQQWREEQKNENPTVEVTDGENSPLGNSEVGEVETYAQNHEADPSTTPEDHQDAGVYVGIMDPNRFLGSDSEQTVTHINPAVEPGQEPEITNVLTPDCAKAADEFGIETSMNDIGLKKIIAVYEEEDEMTQTTTITDLGKLLEKSLLHEGELERAEVTLALRDLAMRMQKMLEDAAKMGTEDIMPMADGLRMSFSDSIADSFTAKSEAALQQFVDAIQALKNIFDSESANVEQRISDEDAEIPMNDLLDMEMEPEMEPEMGDELDSGNFDAELDAALNGEDDMAMEPELEDPLGRTKKESRSIEIKGSTFKLTEEQHKILLAAKAITNKISSLASAPKTVIETIKRPAVIVTIGGKKVRLTENQVSSLVFAKRFYDKTSMMGAKSVRVSKSQNMMLENAKRIMGKMNKGKK